MTKELTGKQLVVLHLQSVEEMKAGKTARSTKVDMLHRRSTVKNVAFSRQLRILAGVSVRTV